MNPIAPTGTALNAAPTGSELARNLDEVKPQPRARPAPRGTAADLGRPSYRTDLQWAGGNGPKSSTSTVSIQQTVKVKVDPNTTATGTLRVLGYGGRNGVQGTDYRAAVGVNRTLPSAPGTKYTVDVTAGANLRQQQSPSFSDNPSFDVTLTGRGEWKASPGTTVFAEASAKEVLAATSQARGRLTVGAVWKPDAGTSVSAFAAGEVRVDQSGARAGQATSFMRTVGVDVSVGLGQDTQLVVGAAHTWGGAGSSTTPMDNDGLSGKVLVRFGL